MQLHKILFYYSFLLSTSNCFSQSPLTVKTKEVLCSLELIDKSGSITSGVGFFVSIPSTTKCAIVTCKSLISGDSIAISVLASEELVKQLKENKANAFKFSDNILWVLEGRVLRSKVSTKKALKHPKLDLAIIPVVLARNFPLKDTVFQAIDMINYTIDDVAYQDSIGLCRDVIIYGYPFSIATKNGLIMPVNDNEIFFIGKYKDSTLNPIVRSGVTSYKNKDLLIIDAISFNENKGSPVIDTKLKRPIGMVTGPIAQLDINGKINDFNTGLTHCITINAIQNYFLSILDKLK